MTIERKKNNFGFIRILFAVTIALIHCSVLAEVQFLEKVTYFFSSETRVNAFFVISGFLVYMSYQSTQSVRTYFSRRIRRILPGYSAVIILCGTLFFFISTYSFMNYYNFEFFKYIITNLLTLNFLAPNLPGVFENNPIQAVNVALWTIKIEIAFYCVVPLISLLASKFKRKRVLLSIYLLSILFHLLMTWLYFHYQMDIFLVFRRQLPGEMMYFISGIALYYYFDIFKKHHLKLFLIASTILITDRLFFSLYPLYPISLAIIVISFATQFKYLGKINKLGDYSLGLYIWHAPVIQVLIALNLFSVPSIGVLVFLILSSLMAFISWRIFEKPFLSKSSHYKKSLSN